jgi:predicted Zn-dependent protease
MMTNSKLKTRIGVFLAALLLVVACSKVPITGRKQLHLLPESQMTAMALQEYQTFLSQNQISNDAANTAMVKRIGGKIATAVTTYMNDHKMGDRVKDYNWEFNLVESKEVNAWCMPGGKVVVYTGILPVTQTESALAVVMGHEIGHAIAQHGNERMSQSLAFYLGGIALDVALSSKSDTTRMLFNTAYGVGSQLGELAFSRDQESEADKLGLVFMAMAGYNPNDAIAFWERMAAQGGKDATPVFLRTHPSDEQRIADIKAYMPQAMKYYAAK